MNGLALRDPQQELPLRSSLAQEGDKLFLSQNLHSLCLRFVELLPWILTNYHVIRLTADRGGGLRSQ
jgi:hypothetical protein